MDKEANVVHSTTWSAGPGCHGGCGVFLYVKEGKLERIEGDPDHPYNRGSLCPRCLALKEYMYHPQRILYPMRRTGKRGENKWERISWDEAYDTIVKRLANIRDQYGAKSVIVIQGTGRDCPHYILAYGYGTPNWAQIGLSGASCYHPRLMAMKINQGDYTVPDTAQFIPAKGYDGFSSPDYKVPKAMILWGHNPITTCNDGVHGHWLIHLMKRGTQAIVVDPVYTWTASKAKIWLQLRPGTDGALALGILNVIVNEGLYDLEFVEKWTHGFDKLKSHLQQYSPEKVSEITWVPANLIREAARLYATSKPATIQWGVPVDLAANGLDVARAVAILWAITGNVEVPGGNVVARPAFETWPYPMAQEAIQELFGGMIDSNTFVNERIGSTEYPVIKNLWWRAQPDKVVDQMISGQPYPIKGAWVAGNNFLIGGANPKRLLEAFSRLDFIVCADLFLNPTIMALADIVLPAATFAEKSYARAWWSPMNAITKAVTVGEARPDSEMMLEVARRLNPNFTWKTWDEYTNHVLKPAGITFEQLKEKNWIWPPLGSSSMPYHRHEKGLLRKDGKAGFRTPTGKIELYSTLLEEWGHNPLPVYDEPTMSPHSQPETARKYPLILTTGGRLVTFFHTEHRQIRSMRRINPYPEIMIHPKTAAPLGIEEGDWVWVENPFGKCKRKATITDNVDPRVVACSHGWWFPEKSPESWFGAWDANVNLLIPGDTYPKTGLGGGQYKSLLCKVYKAESGIQGIFRPEDLE